MQLIYNELDKEIILKQVLSSTLFVSRDGTICYNAETKYRYPIKLTKGTRMSTYMVRHTEKGITNVVSRMVALAWGDYPEFEKEFRIAFKDGDNSNLDYDNLEWVGWVKKTDKPVKQILDYPLYIENDGASCYVKYSRRCYKKYTPNITKLGYRVIPHSCKGLTTQRNRLVLLAWKEVPKNWAELEANHKDCNPANDYYKNLEWLTHQENLLYSINAGNVGNGAIYAKDIPTGKIYTYPNLSLFAEKSEWAYRTLSARLLADDVIFSDNMFVSYDVELLKNYELNRNLIYRHGKRTTVTLEDGTKLLSVISKGQIYTGFLPSETKQGKSEFIDNAVNCLDLETNSNVVYKSPRKAAVELKLSPSVVITSIKKGTPASGRYVFTLAD